MNSSVKSRSIVRLSVCAQAATLAGLALAAAPWPVMAAAPPPVSIAQYPLQVSQPAHPQVLIALGNSQSMDGTFSGAIMTGSGSLGTSSSSGLSLLQNSSSPANFSIPSGFTPPINAGSSGTAPYTVSSNSYYVNGVATAYSPAGTYLVDNSPSRLNIAKAGISAIVNQYLPYADFSLFDYSTSGNNLYTTWVYQMSPTGGTGSFVFTSTTPAPTGTEFEPNPCLNYLSLSSSSTVYVDCAAIAGGTGGGKVTGNVNTSTWLEVAASSDDPLINDVLYASGVDPVCLVYGGPSPLNPYTGNGSYSLAQYNSNASGNVILETYSASEGGRPCATQTGPTNAGYVPYAPQTLYAQRGFGYDAGQSATTSNTVVAMQSAGNSATSSQVTTILAKFTPSLAPETNQTSTAEIKAAAVQAPTAGLLAGALSYYQTNPTTSNGCVAKRYVVLVTDGLPTMDKGNDPWPPPGTLSATNWGAKVAFNADGSLNTTGTNDQAVLDTITSLQSLAGAAATSTASAGIKTYVIGVGAGVDPAANPTAANVLTAMAIAGGTGSYFKATSPGDLVNDMQTILAAILAETGSTSAVSVNTTGINNGSDVYQAQFNTSDTYQDWTGNLLAYPISNASQGTISPTPLWSAQTQLDAQNWNTGRLITTWDPVAGAATPFRWTAGTTATSGIASTTLLGQELQTYTADTSGSDVLNYLRGNSAQEQRNGGVFRNRTHTLGDIIDSAPAYVGVPSAPWAIASYAGFQAANATRSPVIYVGANDGMLHAFDASTTDSTQGNELYAYIPNGVYSNLTNLVSPYYNDAHLFFVDGSPQVQDVQFSNNSWHSVLVSGERGGGKSIFALDVTNPASLTSESAVASSVLWEFTDVNMGLTFSTPTIGYTAAGFVTFFGNGYDSASSAPYLYALNPQTGALLTKINLCLAVLTNPCSASAANGLSSVTLANTSGSPALPANVLYAGDLQGNMWRVDISNASPLLWTVSLLFQARDANGNVQPITTTPAVALNPLFPNLPGTMVYFGTGQFLGTPDLVPATNSSGQVIVQSVYGVYDSGSAPSSPLSRSNLQQQTLTNTLFSSSSGLYVRTLSSNRVLLPTVRGWYVDLNLIANSGERVVTDPVLFNGTLQLSTYEPGGSQCSAGGTSWYMVFNFATGGATLQPQFDVNGDGVVNSGDKTSSGLTVAGMSYSGFLSTPMVTTGSASGGLAILSQTLDLGTTCTGANCNNRVPIAQAVTQAKGAWQEVRQ